MRTSGPSREQRRPISDTSEARGNTVTAREMLDKGAARIDAERGRRRVLVDADGTIYLTNHGITAGAGQVLRIAP